MHANHSKKNETINESNDHGVDCKESNVKKVMATVEKQNNKVGWDSLSSLKKKQFTQKINEIIEDGTWNENIQSLLQQYQLDQYINSKTEWECCLQAFRMTRSNRSIAYINQVMHLSDPYEGRCKKMKKGKQLTVDRWIQIRSHLDNVSLPQFIEEVKQVYVEDLDALLFHYQMPTDSFLWNEEAVRIITTTNE
jgi:hypothetical protein